MQIIVDVIGDISLAYIDFEQTYFESVAKKINKFLGDVDYRIANLESPICLREYVPIEKMGPNLRMLKTHFSFFENLHIDGYTLANNHLGDFGQAGVIDTINVLQDLDKDYVGSSIKYEETYKPLRKVIKDTKLSFISVCENEFGIAHKGKLGAAGYNKEKIKHVLAEERKWADFKIVIFHGGTEYYPYPTPGVRNRYRELVELGANAVIGMHTHCPQGYEIYHNAPIIYSVGNFFFPREGDTPFGAWKFGYIARLTLHKGDAINVNFIPYMFDIYGQEFELIDKSTFNNYIDDISSVIQDEEHLENLYKAWATMRGNSFLSVLCTNLGNLDDKKEIARVKNVFSCEAHNELIKTYLNMLYDDEVEKYYIYVKEIKQHMRIYDRFLNGNLKVNSVEHLSKYDILIWGIGKKAEMLYKEMTNNGKKCLFVDKDVLKQQLNFLGEDIISPQEALCKYKDIDIYICTSEKSAEEIKKFLNDNGIKNVNVV